MKYQDLSKAELSINDGIVRPEFKEVTEEELEFLVRNETRMYPWYTYQGEEVIILKYHTAEQMGFKIIDSLEHSDYEKAWFFRMNALVSVEEVRKSDLLFFFNFLDMNANDIRGCYEAENATRDIFVNLDMKYRLEGLKRRYETWLAWNGKEIHKRDIDRPSIHEVWTTR